MHYYKRNIGDYHKKAGRLSMLEHGAYTLLIDACYDREKFPTKSEAIDWCWARSAEEIAAVEFVLGKFFTESNGVFTQNRISEDLDKYHENSNINKQIAIDRENKKRELAARSVDGQARIVNEPPPNQEPRTKKPRTRDVAKDIKPLDFSTWPQIPDPVILKAWLEMRKRVKASTSQLAINTIGKEMVNAVATGLTVNECLEIAELSGWKGFQTEWVLKARAKNAQQTGFSPALNRGERLQKWAADTTERLEQELAELRSRENNGTGDSGDEEFIPYLPDVDS